MTQSRHESWVSISVRRLRAARRWSRRELSERCGVSAGTIYNIEHGLAMPAVDTLEGVLNELGCELKIEEIHYDVQ